MTQGVPGEDEMTNRAGQALPAQQRLFAALHGDDDVPPWLRQIVAAIEQEVRDDIRARVEGPVRALHRWDCGRPASEFNEPLAEIVRALAISSSSATETQDGERPGLREGLIAFYESRKRARAALAAPTPDDRDREPGTLFDVDWWQRNLSARNGSDRVMAEFIVQTLDFAWPFVSTLRHPDDRDREVERIAALSADLEEAMRGGYVAEVPTDEIANRLIERGWTRHVDIIKDAAAGFADAGLRASGGD